MRSDIVKHRGGLAPWQAKRLAAYIESNIGLNLRVADLAGIVQLSISYFSRAFRKSFGRPPLAYVKERRVRHAQAILLNTREPIAQVALDCGMCDQAHFTRVFRRVVGTSPSLWRRQFQSDPMRMPERCDRNGTQGYRVMGAVPRSGAAKSVTGGDTIITLSWPPVHPHRLVSRSELSSGTQSEE